MDINSLNRLLGNIDIYLLDQILKGRFTKEMKILDAGCGEGRNTVYFLHEGYQIFGADSNPIAIQIYPMRCYMDEGELRRRGGTADRRRRHGIRRGQAPRGQAARAAF